MDIRTALYTTRGASKAVADKLGISAAAVSHWRTRGIPADRLADIEQIIRDMRRNAIVPSPAPRAWDREQ